MAVKRQTVIAGTHCVWFLSLQDPRSTVEPIHPRIFVNLGCCSNLGLIGHTYTSLKVLVAKSFQLRPDDDMEVTTKIEDSLSVFSNSAVSQPCLLFAYAV